jgi:membrane-associated phospholipid phosphatase
MRPLAALTQDLTFGLMLIRRARVLPLGLALCLMPVISLVVALPGLDAAVNQLAQGLMPLWASILWSAPPMLVGMVAPLLVPLVASLRPSTRLLAPRLWAAFLLSLALASLIKAVTGRVHPEATIPADVFERSTQLVLLSGDMFEGWPSGHAAINGAVALTLASLARATLTRRLAAFWALWVWAAVVLGINGQVHWLSDMLAGALLALAVTFSLDPQARRE